MSYILIKNWIVAFVIIIILCVIIINPHLITKYGLRTKTLDNIIRVVALIFLLLWFIPNKSLFLDTINYLKKGKRYVQSDICKVVEVQRTNWFFFAQKSIICSNNKSYVDRFTTKFYHKGDILEIKYLPETKLIVEVDTRRRKQ
jgi:hypothetical protein